MTCTLHLMPQPRSLRWAAGLLAMSPTGVIGIGGAALAPIARAIQSLFPSLVIHASYPGGTDAVSLALREGLHRDGYRLVIAPGGIRIEAGAVSGAYYAVQTLRQIVAQASTEGLPCLEIADWPDFEDRGVYYDVTRGRVPKLEELLRLADRLSRYKINQLQLYIEHAFAFRGHPDIGKGVSPLSAEDILTLDAFCRERHIELVPSLASFGHLGSVLKHPQYHHLAEDWNGGFRDMLSPADPETYAFLDSLFAEFLPLFNSNRFNACCDETDALGRGRSALLCAERGKGRVYLDHVIRVGELAAKYGKKLMFWGDIIRQHPALIGDIPKDATVLDWAYLEKHDFDSIRDFRQAGLRFYACPGTNSWQAIFPRLPQACASIAGFAAAGKKHGAQGLLNTDWGDGGQYNFMEYSWHGFLFGAEQAWNTEADRASFTRRFVACFLGGDDAELAAALDELGEIAFRYAPDASGGNGSLWERLFFGLPDAPAFSQAQPVIGPVVRDGRIFHEASWLDAETARALLPRLARIRAVFADRCGCPGFDPDGVLPYWVFGADTMALAVRKLAAFGPGATPDQAEGKAIRKSMRELRKRFQQLWRARNRESEIAVTLARYDRVLEGPCVRATPAPASPDGFRIPVMATAPADPVGLVSRFAPAPLRVQADTSGVGWEARLGVVSDTLAVIVRVPDAMVTRGDPVWRGSCVELFGSAGATAPVGQVFLAPPAPGVPAAAFKFAGDIVPAPEIVLDVLESGPAGYTLCAWVPLALLRLPQHALAFRLKAVATARQAGSEGHCRTDLFYLCHGQTENSEERQ